MTMDTSNRTFVSSILFLDIVEYSKQSVTDQHALKQRFNTLLINALKHVAPSDRIVLDTGDGAAVSFQGNPEDALFAGMHLRDAIAATSATDTLKLDVRFGINLGPVRLIKDINGQINIIGDGVNVAQRVMSFADAGVILVSRSYFEVVSRLSDDYAKIFRAAGTRTDKHVREHEVYAIGQTTDDSAKATSAAVPVNGKADAPSPSKRNNTKLVVGAVLIAATLLFSLLFLLRQHDTPAPQGEVAKPAEAAVKVASMATPKGTASKANKVTEAKPAIAPTAPVVPAPIAKIPVILAVKPWGEVYVDGKKKGVSPPMKSLTLGPGTHVIEIKNTAFPNYIKTLVVKAGDAPRIEHKF